jgi:drug/metabolite transporter (DMT)-like permease
MRMKIIAGCAFLLNTILFATYYSVTKEALGRIDPIIFTFFEMVSLAPAGLLIVLCSWKHVSRTVVKRGVLLGSTLCLALFTIAIALKYTTATSTAFFPALNGFVAALVAWVLFRESMGGATWLAGLLSLAGAALLIFSSSAGNFRGTLIAFLGGLFYTGYVFLSDHEQKDEKAQWPLFGIELLTTAVWANLIALLFGDWQAVHPALPKDIWVVLYVSVACTFIPTLITVLLQNYISPVTVSFIYILEPVLGAIIANLYLGEVLSVQGYVGGALVVLGALVNTWASMGQPAQRRARKAPAARASWVSTLLYPALGFLGGAFLLARLGGLPPASWSEVARIWPQLAHYLPSNQDYVTLLLIQAGGWLIAWVSVLLMGCLALIHLLRLPFQLARSRPVVPSHSPLPEDRPPAPPVIQPARRVRPTAFQPGQRVGQMRAAPLAHEEHEGRVRTTRRLPEQTAPSTYTPAAPRPRVTRRLPAQSTWYGEAAWPDAPAGNRPASLRSTEPLRREAVQSFDLRGGLSVEKHVH